MINSVELKNFQSHQSNKIHFTEGVNCIIGKSNSGKSAILRGLYWIRYNKPLGNSYIRHGSNEASIVLNVNKEDTVERYKSKKDNKYIINGKELTAFGQNIPDDIINILNIEDINIQKQMDASFLLSSTAGEIGRYINKIVNLSDIDTGNSNIERLKRDKNKEINAIENKVVELELELNDLDWIDAAKEKVETLQVTNKQINNNLNIIDNINRLVAEIKKYQKQAEEMPDIKIIEDQYHKIIDLNRQIKQSKSLIDTINQNRLSIIEVQNSLKQKSNKIFELESNLPEKYECPLCHSIIKKDTI